MVSIKLDSRHLYLQVIERIKRDIETGIYREKDKLPSEFELAKLLGVSRATLREALRILEEENVITRRHGIGTFVNAKPLFSSGIEQLSSITSMIVNANMKPGTIFLSSGTVSATDEDVRRFNCSSEDEIAVMERVRTANGQPVVYCADRVPCKYLPEAYSEHEESLFNILEEVSNRNITYAHSEVEPIGYHSSISPILGCGPEAALLVLRQMHFDETDEPILYSVNYFRADKFSFHVLRKRV